MKEDIKTMMNRIEKCARNPDRYLLINDKEGIRWTQKRRIQQMFDFMKRHIEAQDKTIASLESQLSNASDNADRGMGAGVIGG